MAKEKIQVLVVDYDARSRLDIPCSWAELTMSAGVAEALALAKNRTYDVVVSAARLPGGSCVELFAALHRSGSRARFVAMRNGPFDRDRIPKGHKLASIGHPLDLTELAETISGEAALVGSIPPTHKRQSLLLLESDPRKARKLADAMIHYRCDHAVSLREGRAQLTTSRYDAVITSTHLSDAEGSELLEEISRVSHDTPVVCYSDALNDRLGALQSGAHAFVDEEDIYGIIRTTDLAIAHCQSTRLLRELSLTDTRTGLMGWVAFRAEIAKAMSIAEVTGSKFAIALIDLDHFKVVNDTHGHDTGDVLICEVASRIRLAAMQIGGIPSRFAGDEFGVLLPTVQDEAEAIMKADVILSQVRHPVNLGMSEWTPTCSIGVAVYPAHGTDVKTILEVADHASYEAKRQGRNKVVRCTDEMVFKIREAREVALNLAESVPSKMSGFTILYQPLVDRHMTIRSIEALLRWSPPCGNKVSPEVFIPSLEHSGLILQVGKWVLVNALKDFLSLKEQGCAVERVNVNISVLQLMDPNFPDFVSSLIKSYNVSSHVIGLELTEGEKLITNTIAHNSVRQLHEAGFKWKIDDFGTGYSSMRYLEEFPVSAVKLDRSLVVRHTENNAYISGIVMFAHSLGVDVIAEGIETEEQLNSMLDAGVDRFQGYYFGKPMTVEEILTWNESRKLK